MCPQSFSCSSPGTQRQLQGPSTHMAPLWISGPHFSGPGFIYSKMGHLDFPEPGARPAEKGVACLCQRALWAWAVWMPCELPAEKTPTHKGTSLRDVWRGGCMACGRCQAPVPTNERGKNSAFHQKNRWALRPRNEKLAYKAGNLLEDTFVQNKCFSLHMVR